jgi:hypothetical protein
LCQICLNIDKKEAERLASSAGHPTRLANTAAPCDRRKDDNDADNIGAAHGCRLRSIITGKNLNPGGTRRHFGTPFVPIGAGTRS